MGWLADKLLGKVDNSPIYQEMHEGDRRRPHRCLEWQHKQEVELKRKLEMQTVATQNAKVGERNERLKQQTYLFLKYKLYEYYSPYSCSAQDLERLDGRLMRALIEYIHEETSPEGSYWTTVVEIVEADLSLKPYVPSLFNGKFIEVARLRDEARKTRVRKEREAEETRRRAESAAQKEIETDPYRLKILGDIADASTAVARASTRQEAYQASVIRTNLENVEAHVRRTIRAKHGLQ